MSTPLSPVHGQKPAAIAADGKSIDAKGSSCPSSPQPDTLRPHPDHEAEASCFGYIEECCCGIFTYIAGLAISAYEWVCSAIAGKSAIESEFDDLAKNLPFLQNMGVPCKIFIAAKSSLNDEPLVVSWLLTGRDGRAICAENLREVYTRLLEEKGDERGSLGDFHLALTACHQKEDGSFTFYYSDKKISASGIASDRLDNFLRNTTESDAAWYFQYMRPLAQWMIPHAIHKRPSDAQVVLDRVITPHDSGKPVYLSERTPSSSA
ncbi:MAG: hypothetical protein HYX48_01135 [Chlamydiales bacterium]|nr:hypothetical protein [Chlamydiales bacterium]